MGVGAFIWYDLATTDPAAAAAFYAGVVDWAPSPVPGRPYTLLKTGSAIRAGLHRLPEHLEAEGVPPHWSGHIHVADVDAALADVLADGGECKFGPADIDGVGRFAVVTDPGGAHFYLFTPSYDDVAPDPMSPGSVGWHELHTPDQERALGFYAARFGWRGDRSYDMGPMGSYRIFTYDGADRGGMMPALDKQPRWLFYFVVAGIDDAHARVQAGGGTVLNGPNEVPGGAWTLTCRDPQGGEFALVAPRR